VDRWGNPVRGRVLFHNVTNAGMTPCAPQWMPQWAPAGAVTSTAAGLSPIHSPYYDNHQDELEEQ
jgi:hypothetical protein